MVPSQLVAMAAAVILGLTRDDADDYDNPRYEDKTPLYEFNADQTPIAMIQSAIVSSDGRHWRHWRQRLRDDECSRH